jgi:hypothetical protein
MVAATREKTKKKKIATGRGSKPKPGHDIVADQSELPPRLLPVEDEPLSWFALSTSFNVLDDMSQGFNFFAISTFDQISSCSMQLNAYVIHLSCM